MWMRLLVPFGPGGCARTNRIFILEKNKSFGLDCLMATSFHAAPLGLKADGSPRKRRLGAGRPRLPTDEERRKRVLESKRRWWRLNRGRNCSRPYDPQRHLQKGLDSRCALNVLHPIIGVAQPFPITSKAELTRACFGEAMPLCISSDNDRALAAFLLSDCSDHEVQIVLECTRNAWDYLAADLRRLKRYDPQAPDRWSDRKRFEELSAALVLLKSECSRRRLPAQWLMGRALQMRCTDDAKPCNPGQTDAAQSVEFSK